MASTSAIAKRRIQVVERLSRLPGAIINTEATDTDHAGQLQMRTSGVNVNQHDILLSNVELLEFLDRVLTPLVARVEALESLQADRNMKGNA
jgi:hypothetical protein